MKLTNDNYVDLAENVIFKMKEAKEKNSKIRLVTTTKLRNLLSMLSDIYNEMQEKSSEKLNQEICARLDYLRVRFVYDAGKDVTVKDFIMKANLLEYLKTINGKRSEFLLFYHYMEALVAYFKFYGLDDERK